MDCRLVDVAVGRAPADLLLRNTALIDVYTGEMLEGWDVAVAGGRVAAVGERLRLRAGRTIDLKGLYLAPGFMDGHIHVESSMLTLTRFAETVIPHGTTSVFIDPHEVANVLGLRGVRLMLREARAIPMRVFVTAPSCVPALGEPFETPGAILGLGEVRRMLRWRGVVALGEMMNFPGVVNCVEDVVGKVRSALRMGLPVEGHAPQLPEDWLNAYIAMGISSCHESTSPEEAVAKLRRGMYVMAREGSAWRDLRPIVRGVLEMGLDVRRLILVSDDRHPGDLIGKGHVDYLVRTAVEEGLDPVKAIQCVTINVAEHYGLDDMLGGIAPGRLADMVVLEDLKEVRVRDVYFEGELIASRGVLLKALGKPRYPGWATRTINIPRLPGERDLTVAVEAGGVLNVIGVVEHSAVTRHLRVKVGPGFIAPSPSDDLLTVVVVERHRGTGRFSVGLVRGFGLERGAIASSVAHDSHNLISVGASPRDMVVALREVVEMQGGFAVAEEGRVVARVRLPVAGLMSPEPAEEVVSSLRALEEAIRGLGCMVEDPFMTLSLLALPVIPELRITDRGLVDVREMRIISLIEGA